jgi:hypothetical protein
MSSEGEAEAADAMIGVVTAQARKTSDIKVGRCRLNRVETHVESAWLNRTMLRAPGVSSCTYDMIAKGLGLCLKKTICLISLTMRLRYDKLLSSFAFSFNLRRCIKEEDADIKRWLPKRTEASLSGGVLGRVVQVNPIKPKLKPPGTNL